MTDLGGTAGSLGSAVSRANRQRYSLVAQSGPVVAVIDSSRQRLKPPSNLSPEAKTLFSYIVDHCDPRHFRPAERPLLVAYVRALLVEAYFGNDIGAEGGDMGFKQWESAIKIAASLAVKLRLCPSARYDARAAQRMKPGPSVVTPWEFEGEE